MNTTPDIARLCAFALSELATWSGGKPSLKGDRVSLGPDELSIQAKIEDEGDAQGKRAVSISVDVSANGAFLPVTAVSVGVGADQKDAIETAVSEWAQLVGVALLDAFGLHGQGGPSIPAGGFTVHSGMAGIRGAGEFAWSIADRKQLVDHLTPLFIEGEAAPDEFHSLSLLLVVKPGGVADGECRIDGAVSEAALITAREFPWPTTAHSYMFKQFYVLRRYA
ncbi:MAG: DUF6348 family protein [Pyrinomonadaceae bacterium]